MPQVVQIEGVGLDFQHLDDIVPLTLSHATSLFDLPEVLQH